RASLTPKASEHAGDDLESVGAAMNGHKVLALPEPQRREQARNSDLAYDCRRPDYFHPHAIAALKLVDRGALTSSSVGAMHGEVGHTQFLPGNVLKYAVGNGNLRDKATALAS
ncbi:hypothetical protein EN872_14890, partial [bacterium M00.F.Ca.ET.229.01.1.1]